MAPPTEGVTFDAARCVIAWEPASSLESSSVEMCEHKGVGHPDSLCDGVAEAVSRALCAAYLKAYGAIQHYNVDKALLIGGESAPRFGGGKVVVPPRLIVCGRATPMPGLRIEDFVCNAARDYLRTVLDTGADAIMVESVVRTGSPNLTRVVGGHDVRANDTSFGAGFAPFSALETLVLRAAELLNTRDFRERFPAAGRDFKVMGHRIGEETCLTLALAFIDRDIVDVAHYFATKSAIIAFLTQQLGTDARIVLNALDDPAATSESGLYLTVTGMSAEHGDDGQVGRGNRVCGLITPQRTMSLEAAAGKNAVAHVGKLYNVLAGELAHAIVLALPDVSDCAVQILSTIGSLVESPTAVAVTLRAKEPGGSHHEERVREVVRSHLSHIDGLSARLVRGDIAVF